jgi:HAD superfamily hydrolase (TIGR01509 family)
MASIKAILFDMDGVLIDAREWHFDALNLALSPFDAEITAKDHSLKFDGLSTKTKLKMLSENNIIPAALIPVIEKIKQDRTLRLAAERGFPNVKHQVLLTRLQKKGVPMGVVTNSIRASASYMLNEAKIINFFEFIITNEDVSEPKPNPEGYLLAAEKLKLLPSEILVVEDGKYGVEAAEKAGCKVVKVNSPLDVSLELFFKQMPSLLK